MKLRLPRLRPVVAMLLFTLIAGAAFAAETTGTLTGTVAVMGYSISYAMVLSWLLVPLAWLVTELLPVNDSLQPLVPVVMGAMAALLGHFAFGIDPKAAQAQFFAAAAAGNMNGWVKVMLPWAVDRLKKKPAAIRIGLMTLGLMVLPLSGCVARFYDPTTGNPVASVPWPQHGRFNYDKLAVEVWPGEKTVDAATTVGLTVGSLAAESAVKEFGAAARAAAQQEGTR